jgi:hypothetical protein
MSFIQRWSHPFIIAVLAGVLAHTNAARAALITFTNQTDFQNAIGTAYSVNFQDFPLNASGFGSYGHNYTVRSATFDSIVLNGNIDLFNSAGADTGFDGMFLVERGSLGGANNVFVRPGGQGIGGAASARTDDDFIIRFASPVKAAGLSILDNILEPNEIVEFLDVNQTRIGDAIPLPSGDGYIGLVTQAGGPKISAIRVLEDAGPDDIAFDNLVYSKDPVVVPEPACALSLAIAGALLLAGRAQRT